MKRASLFACISAAVVLPIGLAALPAAGAGPCALSACTAPAGAALSLSFGQNAPSGWARSILFFTNVDNGNIFNSRTYTASQEVLLAPQGRGSYSFTLPNLCATSPNPWNFVVIGTGPATQITQTVRIGGPMRASGTFTPQCASVAAKAAAPTPTPTAVVATPSPAPTVGSSCGRNPYNRYLAILLPPCENIAAGSDIILRVIGNMGPGLSPNQLRFRVHGTSQYAGATNLGAKLGATDYKFAVPAYFCTRGRAFDVGVYFVHGNDATAEGDAGVVTLKC